MQGRESIISSAPAPGYYNHFRQTVAQHFLASRTHPHNLPTMFLKQTAYKPKSRTSSQSSQSTPPLTPADAPNAAATTNPDPKPRTNSQTWEDRRFMWQTGTGRKSSFSAGGAGAGNDAVPAVQKPSIPSPFAMTKPNTSENPHPTSFVKRASTGCGGFGCYPWAGAGVEGSSCYLE